MNDIFKAGLGAATLAALAVPSMAAAAVTISGSVSASFTSSDPGLVIYATPTGFSDFVLTDIGDAFAVTTSVLTVGTEEGSVEIDDRVNLPISATFTFTSPLGAGGTVSGTSDGFYQLNPFGSCGLFAGGCGRIQWNNPTTFAFGNGGLFEVTLSDVAFRTPDTAVVTARFELLANSVPEPTTWALLILGFGVIGGALRSQRKTRTQHTYA